MDELGLIGCAINGVVNIYVVEGKISLGNGTAEPGKDAIFANSSPWVSGPAHPVTFQLPAVDYLKLNMRNSFTLFHKLSVEWLCYSPLCAFSRIELVQRNGPSNSRCGEVVARNFSVLFLFTVLITYQILHIFNYSPEFPPLSGPFTSP